MINDKENFIVEIPNNVLFKEDDAYTGFEAYLIETFGEKIASKETQTERVVRRHIKLGVTPGKLGATKDRETFIDPRMF
jgi:hypothetical protein